MLKGQIMLSAKIFSIVLVYVVVQFYSWFNFFPFGLYSSYVIRNLYYTQK